LADKLFELFDEYAVRYARGEQPDPCAYLERAGNEADALAEMLDRLLQWAPAPAPDEIAVTLMQAWLAGESPLRELRVQRGLRVEDVVGQLAMQFDIDLAHTGKLRRYFQRLERGALDVGRVDSRVLETLAAVFQTTVSMLRGWASPPRGAQVADAPAYRNVREPTVAPAVPLAADESWDEVDELFLGPRAGA
jgi:transcriptional regulator with XRE-family HTH domain